jgi:hypothetical protein
MSLKRALLLGLVVAWVSPAQAEEGCGAPGCAPAPCFKTVCVTEWVPEHYETVRTVYKTVCATENYTAYRTECVPETRTRVVTVYKSIPVVKEECRTVYKCVPTVETRTCWKTEVVCKTVTTIKRKCVDQGHWQCKEVCCEPNCFDKMKWKWSHRGCCDDCCMPAKTKTVKEWVPNKVWIETPCTHVEKTCVKVPYTTQVTVMKSVPVQETFKVTTHTCVPEQVTQTYTVNVERKVAYQATRTVARCVPVQEKVTACRMVARTVEKQVPVEECCTPAKHSRKCCK